MAKLKKNILGQVTGALGEVVFKQFNGENYMATRPDSFMPGVDPESIARRSRFALAIRLARAINQSERLKSIWSIKTPAGVSVFNYIFKRNYPFVSPSGVSDGAMLIPDVGFGVTVSAVNLTSTGLTVDISAIGTNAEIITASEPNISMIAVLFLSNPADPLQPAYNYLTLESGNLSTTLNTALSFSALLTSQETQLFNLYQDQKAFFVLTTLDASGAVVHYSSTVLAV